MSSHEIVRVTRIGLGHPEGFLEAFATIYSDVADALVRRRNGNSPSTDAVPIDDISFPTIKDGVIGIRFVEAVVASHIAEGRWTAATIDL